MAKVKVAKVLAKNPNANPALANVEVECPDEEPLRRFLIVQYGEPGEGELEVECLLLYYGHHQLTAEADVMQSLLSALREV